MPMHANPYGQSEIASFLADLQTLESMQAALQAKQYGEFMHGVLPGGENTPHRWRKIVLRHMNALLRTAFREMYGLSGMDIAEGQTVADAVLAAADHAAANKQWELLGRCLDAYRTAAYGAQPPPALLQEQINACRNFVAASNYERVGDLDRAVAGYLAVLQAPAERSPVEAAVAALERLHKEHPDIFERTRNVPVGATPAAVPVAPTPLPQPASPPTGAAHGNGISVTDQSTGPAS